eukprot:8011748-Pyramimonas_sp.AAC.1
MAILRARPPSSCRRADACCCGVLRESEYKPNAYHRYVLSESDIPGRVPTCCCPPRMCVADRGSDLGPYDRVDNHS